MSVIRWDPFDEVDSLRRSMERAFDGFFTPRRTFRDMTGTVVWEPAVEMYETDGEVVVRAELPNIDPKQIDITVTGDAVTLKGQTRSEQEQKGRNYYRREIRYGAFTRTLPLATEVKNAEAQASYKDGVLEVKIPKSERVKPTTVKVQAN
jgi:HSP20 family protein